MLSKFAFTLVQPFNSTQRTETWQQSVHQDTWMLLVSVFLYLNGEQANFLRMQHGASGPTAFSKQFMSSYSTNRQNEGLNTCFLKWKQWSLWNWEKSGHTTLTLSMSLKVQMSTRTDKPHVGLRTLYLFMFFIGLFCILQQSLVLQGSKDPRGTRGFFGRAQDQCVRASTVRVSMSK